MVNIEIKVKDEFFISTLFVENMITTYLSDKLKVLPLVESKFLGNHEDAITFDQKIQYLYENNGFSIIDKSKLSAYREIRKELLQNKDACSFEDCLTSSDNNDDFLLILYPQSEFIPREEKLTNACYQLIGEVSELVSNFTNKPEIKLRKENIFSIGKKRLKLNQFDVSKITFLFAFLFLK